MIRDIKNCREVHLGFGTVGISIDTTGSVEILYNKPCTPVGNYYNKLAGKSTIELKEKNVCLFFDGKDGLKALDILIEDLQKIRDKKLQEIKIKSCENCKHHYTDYDCLHDYCNINDKEISINDSCDKWESEVQNENNITTL